MGSAVWSREDASAPVGGVDGMFWVDSAMAIVTSLHVTIN